MNYSNHNRRYSPWFIIPESPYLYKLVRKSYTRIKEQCKAPTNNEIVIHNTRRKNLDKILSSVQSYKYRFNASYRFSFVELGMLRRWFWSDKDPKGFVVFVFEKIIFFTTNQTEVSVDDTRFLSYCSVAIIFVSDQKGVNVNRGNWKRVRY